MAARAVFGPSAPIFLCSGVSSEKGRLLWSFYFFILLPASALSELSKTSRERSHWICLIGIIPCFVSYRGKMA